MIRLLIADDHAIVREGLVAILDAQPDFEVVGEAGDGEQAVEAVDRLEPDIILMDLEMPKLNGAEAIRRIKSRHPTARIVVLTGYDTDERILDAIQAGAQGYLLKGVPAADLIQGLRVVDQGGSLLQPAVAARLLSRVGQMLTPTPAAEQLTPRELEVLEEMAQGARNKEIAAKLSITEATVKFHSRIIFQKLGVDSRSEAIVEAIKRGIVKIASNR